MLTYQIRQRTFRITKGEPPLEFPNDVEVSVVLSPGQPFGMEAGGGRTTVRGVGAQAKWNYNTGHYFIVSNKSLDPLEVRLIEPHRIVELKGNEMLVKTRCEPNHELTQLIDGLYYALPLLLNIDFADPPVIEEISGKVGDMPFRWELLEWRMNYETSSQETQEQKVVTAWERFGIISVTERARLLAAMHYFHVACRLSRAGLNRTGVAGGSIC